MRDRDRAQMWEGQREREKGDTESEGGSRLWAVSTEPPVGLELTDHEIMTWAEVGRLTDWATQAPLLYFLLYLPTISTCLSVNSTEGGRHRIWSRLQALSCQHRAPCGAWTHELRDHDLSRSRTLNRLSHPGAPSYLFLREYEQGRGTERERENPKQALCCQCRAWCGAQSHELWDHDLSQNQESEAYWLSHPGALINNLMQY